MDFINEKNGGLRGAEQARGLANVAQDGDVGRDAAGAHKTPLRGACDHLRQRGFSRAGRTEQNHVRQPVRLDHAAQQFAWPENVILPDDLFQPLRTHPRRQRRRGMPTAFRDLAVVLVISFE